MCSRKVFPIRPHHGMCLAYFEGKGYSGEFTAHMGEMLKIFQNNVPVHLVVGADEICRKCPNRRGENCTPDSNADTFDRAVLELCGLREGEELSFLEFADRVQSSILGKGLRESICGGCRWNDICTQRKSLWEAEDKKRP